VTVRTSGVRQASTWGSIVSDDAPALKEWLVGLGFTEDILIPGERPGAIHHCQLDWPDGGRVMLSSTGERPTPCGCGPLRDGLFLETSPRAGVAKCSDRGCDLGVQELASDGEAVARFTRLIFRPARGEACSARRPF